MPLPVLNLLNHSIFVRTVGSLSCVVGLLCFALSSSFKSLFGEWNNTKIILCTILSSIISVVVLFAGKRRVSGFSKLKPHVEFVVLMLTSLYSFLADRSTKGTPDTLSVISSGAFAVTCLCLSRQIKPGFDFGLFSFFLGCVTVQLMKIHFIFILVAAGFCYPLVVFGSYSESQSENGDSSAEGSVEIRIDGENRASVGMGQDKAGQIRLRRRVRNDPIITRRCANCLTTSMGIDHRGPKSLCNDCGTRYLKVQERAAFAAVAAARWEKETKGQ